MDIIPARSALDAQQARALTDHEQTIERGLATFVDVGRALLAIRDGRLYRGSYGTFEAYHRERWGFERAHAYRLIEGARVAEVMSPMGDIPTNVRQACELAPLLSEPEELRAVWQETLERTGGRPTAAAVREVREVRAYERAVEEFPELAPEASPGLPAKDVVAIAADLRAIPEGPQREKRREAAATWHKVKSTREPTGGDPYTLADNLIAHIATARNRIEDMGGAETLAAGVAVANDQLALRTWEAEIESLRVLLTQLTDTCRPALRIIK
jgi:hypothetical protein